jgi:hypothetical protein
MISNRLYLSEENLKINDDKKSLADDLAFANKENQFLRDPASSCQDSADESDKHKKELRRMKKTSKKMNSKSNARYEQKISDLNPFTFYTLLLIFGYF